METAWLTLIATATTALIGIAPKAWKTFKAWRGSAERMRVVEGLRHTRRTYAAIEEIATVAGAERVILFAGHNSGGIPRPSSPFWVSSTYLHATSSEMERVISEYQNLKVDAAGIQVLLDSQTNDHVVLDVVDMPSGMLKKHYAAEGVQYAVIFFVDIIENKFFFVSMARHSGPFTPEEITRASFKVNVIRQSMLAYRGE